MESFIKERIRPEPGSIPALLGMFERELRFYREVAPKVGPGVPACYEAEETASGYRLVLEDLSTWREGADPVRVAAGFGFTTLSLAGRTLVLGPAGVDPRLRWYWHAHVRI